MMFKPATLFVAVSLTASVGNFATAEDFFLTIGGGYTQTENQVSLENNVRLFQRTLADLHLGERSNDIYFSDGADSTPDVQVVDPQSVPKANRLMAEFFGSDDDLGLFYRNHQIPRVRAAASPANIRQWFAETGSRMKSGDRLVLYVTAHGHRSDDRNNAFNTSIATWNNTSVKMAEFVRMLDRLPAGVQVVTIMVQCYAGGFARYIFNDGDPARGVSRQARCGFFATVHDRPAAGCTPEVDEASYVEYSTYFFAALSGQDRSGAAIRAPDYNSDGVVSFDEAHAYTMLTADTIDVPVTTSSEFLDVNSRIGAAESDLLTDAEPYDRILSLATPSESAILEGLSEQLGLTGSDRVSTARREAQPRRGRGRFRGRRRNDPADELRRRIAADLEKRWPELANLLNPGAIDLLTVRSSEFIAALEGHPDYSRYRALADNRQPVADEQKRIVKYERFLRIADNVVLAENLKRIGDSEMLKQFQAIVRGESGTLSNGK
ncbi:MAG: hypothetical protein R3C19_14425 [Planctomycetaceae bacterium]